MEYKENHLNGAIISNNVFTKVKSKHALHKEMIKQIRKATNATYTALYLYEPSKEDYEIVQENEQTKKIFKRFIFLDDVISKDQLINKESFIFDGNKALINMQLSLAYLIPIQQCHLPIGYLLLGFAREENRSTNFQSLVKRLCKEIYFLLGEKDYHMEANEKANKYELMYRVTRKIHSTMNPSEVLSEIVYTIQSIYPDFTCQLFLSTNIKEINNLPATELIYNETFANKLSVVSFSTGEIKIEQNIGKNKSNLFAPLRGKQGIYGVLQIKVAQILEFQPDTIDFIRFLADTAGNALENAQLYQQSTQLISDLQLINDITHKLNSNLRLSDTANYLKQQLKSTFHVDDIAFILFDQEANYTVLQESSTYFYNASFSWFAEEIFPVIKSEKEAVFVGDFSKKYSNCNIQLRSTMIVPMIQSDQLKGVIILSHHEPNFFSFDDFKLIQSIVDHSTLAFVNSILREQLEQSVITDYLTKLYSRRYLDEKCGEHVQIDEQGIFLLIDIDDFKQINDTHGHEVGDALIIQVANIIRENINEPGFAARWGGEELAVYLPNMNIEQGMRVASKIVIQIEESTNPVITVSVGIAHWHQDNREKMQSIFDRADRSLYEAKRLGKNGVAKIT
ncbi:putative diguanylate cyclase YdaM [Paraliobacillus sp. PM-2]|uniref:sensor domain-containing diguanylate cyclase n=1 Tax=Paraliobacillus sp. PM-2 TaxID=1462524 RepID=UPI00061C9F25|nr:sensor domain-containing diguanylate cyclase [Paraliobacillus sp. PM-2]CQR48144.1 putative diguanylate cyclase YdaM [Paraliobacillus sp. PM-2]